MDARNQTTGRYFINQGTKPVKLDQKTVKVIVDWKRQSKRWTSSQPKMHTTNM